MEGRSRRRPYAVSRDSSVAGSGLSVALVFFTVMGLVVLSMLTPVLGRHLSKRLSTVRRKLEIKISDLTELFQSFVPCFDVVCEAFGPLVQTAELWRGCLNVDTGIGDNGMIVSSGVGENGETYRACGPGNLTLDGAVYQDGDLGIFDSFREMWLKTDGSPPNLEEVEMLLEETQQLLDELLNISQTLTNNITLVNSATTEADNVGNLVVNPGFDNSFTIKSIVGGLGINVANNTDNVTLELLSATHAETSVSAFPSASFFDAYDGGGDYDYLEVIEQVLVSDCDPGGSIFNCDCWTTTNQDTRFIKSDLVERRNVGNGRCRCAWLISFAGKGTGQAQVDKTFHARANCWF